MEAVVGLMVGLVLGLTGAGGAIFAVPLFMLMLNYSNSYAAGISLGVVGFSAAIGVLGRLRQRVICWRSAAVMVAGGALFAPLGRWLATQLDERLKIVCFSLLAFYIAAGMLQKARDTKLQVAAQGDDSGPENPPSECAPATAKKSGSATILAICGAVTGVLAGIFGVGGGFLVVPILTLVVGMDVRRAIATSLLVIAVVSTSGFISHLWLESLQSVAGLVPLALGAAGGMAIGTALVKRIPAHRLQEIFAACVVGLVSVTLVREFLA